MRQTIRTRLSRITRARFLRAFPAILLFFTCPPGHAVALKFTSAPPPSAEIATPIHISWTSDAQSVSYRYQLKMPGDWKYGARYLLHRWSEWGNTASVLFKDFVLEGDYEFTVEAKDAQGQTVERTVKFHLDFVDPTLWDQGIHIDWPKVNAAKTDHEKYVLLAEEYRQAYEVWMTEYRNQLRALHATTSPHELVSAIASPLLGEETDLLVRAASNHLPLRAKLIVKSAKLYEFVMNASKQVALDTILVYRNVNANRAAFSAITAYWAWQGYKRLATKTM